MNTPKSQPSFQTPLSNTGVTATNKSSETPYQYRLDWIQGTFSSFYLPKVFKICKTVFSNFDFVKRNFGVGYFADSYIHPSGALIGQNFRSYSGDSNNSDICYLQLSGSTISKIKQSRLRKLIRFLSRKCKFNFTRIDADIDDYSKTLDINKIKKAVDKNQYVGFRNTPNYREYGIKGSRGQSISFGHRGSRGSGKYIVIYDKFKESKGKIDCIRIEISFYNIFVEQFSQDIIESPFLLWGEIIKGWIIGSLDFRLRKNPKDKNPGRCPRLKFWDKIFNNSVELKPSRTYKNSTLDTLKSWVRYQVAPTISVLLNSFCKYSESDFWDFFWELVYHGESRLKDKHLFIINSA